MDAKLLGDGGDAKLLGDGGDVPGYCPLYCHMCTMWVNGQGQMDDHVLGKKHRKNRKAREGGECKKVDTSASQVEKSQLDYANLDLHEDLQMRIARAKSRLQATAKNLRRGGASAL